MVAPTSCTVLAVIVVAGRRPAAERADRYKLRPSRGTAVICRPVITWPSLRADGLHVQRIVVDGHRLGTLPTSSGAFRVRAALVSSTISFRASAETGGLHIQFIMANRQNRESVIALAVAASDKQPRVDFPQAVIRIGNDAARRVLHRAGNASACAGPQKGAGQKSKDTESSAKPARQVTNYLQHVLYGSSFQTAWLRPSMANGSRYAHGRNRVFAI